MADGDSKTPNPYIRTYAGDLAALQNKTSPAAVAPSNTPTPTPVDNEREAVLARLRERAVKDPVKEGDLLPNKLPTPMPKAESTGPAILPQVPRSVVPPPLPPPPAPKPVPPPAPVLPSSPPLPRPPVLTPPRVPLNPPPPPPPPIPLSPKPAPAQDSPRPIHTYSSDFSDRIDTKGASTFSVLAAQSDAGEKAPKPEKEGFKRNRGVLITVAGVVLVLLAGGGAFAVYRYVADRGMVASVPGVPSLVFADERASVKGEGRELLQAIATNAQSSLGEGQVRVVYLAQSSTTANNQVVEIPLSGGRLIGSLQLSAPDILLRNVAPDSTAGIVHAGPETRAFFILRVLSYERTFAGMLQWEDQMQSAFSPLYPDYPLPEAPPTVVTTKKIVNGKQVVSTTTVPAAPVTMAPARFIDEIVANHDTRALKDAQGRTILIYGYKDKELLIIARDEAAFTELVRRLSATKQQ